MRCSPVPFACHGAGPSSEKRRRMLNSADAERPSAEREPEMCDDEVEGRELEQRVEADVALDAEAVEAEEELGARAELDGVGRDGEVGVDADARASRS